MSGHVSGVGEPVGAEPTMTEAPLLFGPVVNEGDRATIDLVVRPR